MIDQKKHKIKTNLDLEPHDYPIYCVNIDLRHQYGISVTESQTFLLKWLYSQATARLQGKKIKMQSMAQDWMDM